MINLYKLDYTGCRSCFSCKRIGGKSYGHCPIKDDLKPILQDLENSDGIVLGSPIYLGDVTGEMRSFFERLTFQYLVYDANIPTIAPKKLSVGCIYTMNVTEEFYNNSHYPIVLSNSFESVLGGIFQKPYSLKVFDTYQFRDYDKYVSTVFDKEEKRKRREEHFPIDLDDAYKLGSDVALRAIKIRETENSTD